ncbi:hypothetical protein BX659_1154 [Orenia metallireducens]|jgi:hypothetical protein|uniref:Pirin n=1 Tax=Orenia metallireducens TaxID=1413210 RepID=A0A285HC90_9FIRM|nr:pirin family protein [Orenia metallireducens]PRX27678.1 hypothetical protein BX659_1154 [Orenia metallireducens]SNY33350.1 hypothetical protein SAMN06265827_1174 [Orenia metallireducens]
MIEVVPAKNRYKVKRDWIESNLSFSFRNYTIPNSECFGSLCAFNDDIIRAGEGFEMHPHNNLEIVTYVIDGVLGYQDSLGNNGIVEAGGVQRISAGTGIEHLEYNYSDDEDVHFLQLWFEPEVEDLEPSWEQNEFAKEDQLNRLLPVISGHDKEGTVKINQDIDLYLATFEAGESITYRHDSKRKLYLFVIKGEVIINNDCNLSKGDSLRIREEFELNIGTEVGAELMLIDLV